MGVEEVFGSRKTAGSSDCESGTLSLRTALTNLAAKALVNAPRIRIFKS